MTANGAGTDFIAYCEQVMRDSGRLSKKTVANLRTSVNVLKNFVGKESLPLEDLDGALVNALAYSLAEHGISESTSRSYLRPLSVAYNRAVREGLTDNVKPFNDVNLSVQVKTVKNGKKLRRIWVPEDIGTVLERLGKMYLTNEQVKERCETLEKDIRSDSIREIVSEVEEMLESNPQMENSIRELLARNRHRRRH